MLLNCFAPLNVGYVQNQVCNVLLCGQLLFLCSCVYDNVCMEQITLIYYYYI